MRFLLLYATSPMAITATRRSELRNIDSLLAAGCSKPETKHLRGLLLGAAWHPDYTSQELKYIKGRLIDRFNQEECAW